MLTFHPLFAAMIISVVGLKYLFVHSGYCITETDM